MYINIFSIYISIYLYISYISIFISISISLALSLHLYSYILRTWNNTQKLCCLPRQDIHKILWTLFCWWGATGSRLDGATTRRQFTFCQKFLLLIRSKLERWKAEMTLKPSSGFQLVSQPSITKYKLKSQFKLNCELFQSEFSVLSGKLIKNIFPLHICRPNDYTIEICILLQIQFYNIFTNVPSIFKSCH